MELSPDDIYYDVITYRASSSQRIISVTNTGSAPLHFTTAVDPAATWLRVLPPDSTVAPGWVDQITVTLRPGSRGEDFSALGNYLANLTIRSDDPAAGEVTIAFLMRLVNRAPDVRLAQSPALLGLEDDAVTLDAAASVDLDSAAPIARWAWAWTWEPAASAAGLPGPQPDERGSRLRITRLYGGTLRANVTATDGEGAAATAAALVFVPPEALEITFAFAPGDTLPQPGTTPAPSDPTLALFAVHVSEALEIFPSGRLRSFSFAAAAALAPVPTPTAPPRRGVRAAAAGAVLVRLVALPAAFESVAQMRARIGRLEAEVRLGDFLETDVARFALGAAVPRTPPAVASLGPGAIAGAVIAAVAGCAVAGGAALWFVKRRRRRAGTGWERPGAAERAERGRALREMDLDEGVEFFLDEPTASQRAAAPARATPGRTRAGRGEGGGRGPGTGRLVDSGRLVSASDAEDPSEAFQI